MEKKKNTQLIIIGVLSFAILFMSVGFATYATNLTINGTTTFGQSKWSVHFDASSYNETTGGKAQAVTENLGNTSITYSTTLSEPGEFAEFTVNVINDGTFDATLTKLTMSVDQSKPYMTYKVWYGSNTTPYTSTANNLSIDLPHASGSNTVPVKVRVDYVQPELSSELPTTTSESVECTLVLDYVQKVASSSSGE